MISAPEVTIVLATYNRPDTLRVAIQSVLLQSYSHWKMLVIGDHCDARTEAVVEAFADDRIQYINLPIRAGEQSGPNSVGIALAKTEYLAFLNHDDIWLKDHLEYGLKTLKERGAEFFVGKSAFAVESIETNQGQRKPLFDRLLGDDRHSKQGVSPYRGTPQLRLIEPASAWLLRTYIAKKVGWWRGRDQVLGVYPIQDWVRRAWKQDVRFVFGTQLSVLKIDAQCQPAYGAEKGQYNRYSQEHAFIYPILETMPPDDFRQMVLDEIWANQKPGIVQVEQFVRKVMAKLRTNPISSFRKIITRPIRVVLKIVLSPLSRWLYCSFGFDLLGFFFGIFFRLLGKQRDAELVSSVKIRTGEVFIKQYDIDTIVQMTLASLSSQE